MPPDENGNLVGLIGVGLLGGAIARRLSRRGFSILAYDPKPNPSAPVNFQPDPETVFSSAEQVILCLPTHTECAHIIELMRPINQRPRALVDTTTGAPQSVEQLARHAQDFGTRYIEALVAGSSDALEFGQAQLFVGGKQEDIQYSEPVLRNLSGQVRHLGPIGGATRFKLVHNLILGLHRATLAEGLEFAKGMGLDPGRVLDVLKESPARSEVMEQKGDRMLYSGYDPPQARLAQHLKDVRLMLLEAERLGRILPLTEAHQTILERAEELGFGNFDNSAVIEALREPFGDFSYPLESE